MSNNYRSIPYTNGCKSISMKNGHFYQNNNIILFMPKAGGGDIIKVKDYSFLIYYLTYDKNIKCIQTCQQIQNNNNYTRLEHQFPVVHILYIIALTSTDYKLILKICKDEKNGGKTLAELNIHHEQSCFENFDENKPLNVYPLGKEIEKLKKIF